MVSYSDLFTSNQFIQNTETGIFTMTITNETLANLSAGSGIRLSKLLRRTGTNKYENVIAAYEVRLNGDLLIYSDEAFDGMLVITSDE